MINRQAFVLFSLLLLTTLGYAQNKPAFWDDVSRFRRADSIKAPAKGQILFVGSSSFTRWSDVASYFPEHRILNRGFGGSTLADLIRYAPDVILPYEPSQIVIYCGENDLASADTVTPAIVYNRFVTLYGIIREKYPTVPLAFISIKPSPSRMHLVDKMIGANELIRDFLSKQSNAAYIDVFSPMLNGERQPLADIFVEDRLHMNAKGYAIWQKVITPYLIK